ncbi:MAG: hypothetical protein ACRCTL_05075 [Pseudomonas sp.]
MVLSDVCSSDDEDARCGLISVFLPVIFNATKIWCGMNFIFFYKGSYAAALRGPEMRYVAVAKELMAKGHSVTLCGKAGGASVPSGAIFVSVSRFFALLAAFFRADVIVLHGGGPLVLLLAILAAFLNRRVILDGYAPCWIELDALAAGSGVWLRLKLLVKSSFNVARTFLGGLVFDLVLAANKRQLDLYRGMVSPFMATRNFSRIVVVPFGCEQVEALSIHEGRHLLSSLGQEFDETDFLIGWLGGAYGWFDLDFLLGAVSSAIVRNKKIKMVFFGVDAERQQELLNKVDSSVRVNIIFLPWVDFSRRLQFWSAFDVSLVWGGQGYENDYASRTRNFDCLSLGLPIVQNEDDEWGGRLRATGAGLVSTALSLSEDLYRLSASPEELKVMRKAMILLADEFRWSIFAESLMRHIERPVISPIRRAFGLLGFLLALPALLLFFVLNMASIIFCAPSSNES